MKKAVFSGTVINGQLHFNGTLTAFEGKPITVTVERKRSIRSRNQNDYFHGVICGLLSEHTGYEPTEMKDILKQKFLLVRDDKFPRCRKTSELNTEEMSNFMDQCIRWAAIDLGLVIPDPDREHVA